MYTDDSLKAVVGPEMLIIVLSCFHRLVGPAFNSYDVTELSAPIARLLGLYHSSTTVPKPMGLNLTAASTAKWLGGRSATFLGVEFSGAYGVAWLSMPKRYRVLHELDSQGCGCLQRGRGAERSEGT